MAVAADTAAAYDSLLKTTLDNYRGKLVDNIFNKHVLSWLLMDKNRTRMDSGGENIVEHLLVGDGEARAYNEWDSVDITPQGGIATAQFPWKQLVSTIAISGLEEFKNQGEQRILNLLKARTQQSEKTLQKLVNDQLWGLNTTGFGSVVDYIDDVSTVGGINPATVGNEYWKSKVRDADVVPALGTDFTALNTILMTLYNDSSDGNDHVDAIISDQSIYEKYSLGLQPQVRFQDTRSANLGFQNVMFMGVPMYWDKAAPAGSALGINSDYLTLVGGKGRWFKQSRFTDSPIDGDGGSFGGAQFRDARYAVITAFGNLTISERRKHFKLKNFG